MCAQMNVCIVTGSRADFGLLTTVMDAIDAHESLVLQTLVTGTHLLAPDSTVEEVRSRYRIDAQVVMQHAGHCTRMDDAIALGRGVEGCAKAFETLSPEWVVVLGDRIEAFAAASAASVMGVPVAHIHGGDRASGVADEAMRHAISKVSHLHLAATEQSAARIGRMGEDAWRIHTVGSPAIDLLDAIPALDDEAFGAIGEPEIVVLMHPTGREPDIECNQMVSLLDAVQGLRTLVLDPNHDAGREGIVRAIEKCEPRISFVRAKHMGRSQFVGLLKRLAASQGVLIGNSSAALIEAAALRLPAVDIGPRQSGRERAENVVHIDTAQPDEIRAAIARANGHDREVLTHPYGAGDTGTRIADILATTLRKQGIDALIRKRNTY